MAKDWDNENDISDFFDEFDKIDKKDDFNHASSFSYDEGRYDEDRVVANRAERHGKSPKKNIITEKLTSDKKNNLGRKGSEEEITDLSDIFGYSERDVPEKKPNSKKQKKIDKNRNKEKYVKQDKHNKDKHNKKKRFRWIKRFFAAAFIFAVLGMITVTFILQDTQNIKWDNIYDYLSEASVIYDDEGKEIESIYSSAGNRVISDYEDMPDNLKNAFIAIEDKTFWEHHGFNVVRMAGAVWEAVSGDGRIGGTSTVTQQLARNLWLTESKSERSLIRKIKEAYYAIQLERHLSKEEILEAYLNTISLGQNTLGVQSASQMYFSKDVKDLTLLESAALASLAKSPGNYSYIEPVASDEVSEDDPRIVKVNKVNTYLYNDTAEGRVQTVLNLMEEQSYISSKQHDKAKVSRLKNRIKPNIGDDSNEAQFFVDYTIKALSRDLQKEYNLTEQEAAQMVYSGGLQIHTTLNRKMQKAAEDHFSESTNFPDVTNLNTDSNGNLVNDSGGVILYKYSNYLDGKGNFVLKKDEFAKQDSGGVLLKKGRRLNFYETESPQGKDINIEFKSLYKEESGTFYSIDGGVINIPMKYKSFDEDKNVIIDAKFFGDKDYEGFMRVKKRNVVVPKAGYSLRQQIQQPQSSMVVMNHGTGHIKAMVGGRNIEGRMNYNRATSPRQPGSSIKPIAVYAPALELGAQLKNIKNGESSYGTFWTAGSVIKDEQMKFQGKVWPKNWYGGYRGSMTLRKAVEQSVNTIAVKVLNNIGKDTSVKFLEDLGVSTLVTDKASVTDLNPAALALGGMARGISPMEMTAAYATFPNKGVYVEPKPYSEIKTKKGALVMKSEPETRRVMDEGTAFIMNDILRTTVTNGIAGGASLGSQPVAGKTGTTSDNYDAWFVGSTPEYTAALWIGNDISIELSEGSPAATALWRKIMTQATDGDEKGEFPDMPPDLEEGYAGGRSEYFIDGTAP